MNTILDIVVVKKEYKAKTYEIKSLEDLALAIKDSLLTNPLSDFIYVKMHESIDLGEWVYHKGINYSKIGYNSLAIITFRNYERWVYFLNNKPVFFDDRAVCMEYHSHESSWANKIYDTLEFDRYEKINF
jgi:hypothetical protein